MYRKGISFRRIADLCDAPVSTVHRHLQRRTSLDPGLRNDYLANKPKLVRAEPSKDWWRGLQQLETFMKETCRTPVTTGLTKGEKGLAHWLSRQRLQERRGQLTVAQKKALDETGEWRTTVRMQQDTARWHYRLGQTQEFLKDQARWPRYHGFDTEEERVLGVWLHGQRQNKHRHAIPGTATPTR